ncbi:hypothetical protein E5329_05870 [Petralouisia muris]|uniref:Uncharacterized protein n=1 Tax=Petralouisia muris TaxID=3032872 RepID=A0AC61RYV8_9FIRM|nr:hypothetical protein E5329_05870 [Petralouisia muris]
MRRRTALEHQYFHQALADFVGDMAYGGAICHLADLGYTVEQIIKELDYPISRERAGAAVWQHYLAKGIILLEEPQAEPLIEKVSYVREYGKYGAAHFRRVVEKEECPQEKYYPCDFGKKRYQNEASFLRELESLQRSDREYILGLPWPLQRVYHAADQRMTRIMKTLGN